MNLTAPAIDCFRMLVDLSEREWKLEQISLQIGVPESTIRHWKQGTRPRYEDAVRLIDLWCGATGKLISEVPRQPGP